MIVAMNYVCLIPLLLIQDIGYTICCHTFRRRKVVLNDRFDDQDEEIQNLLKDKKLNRNALRERIRAMKNM